MTHKRLKKQEMFAHTWTTHIILGNFTLPGFRNCVKALAPSVKGRGNMEIIKHFLILKFHLSLKDSDYYNTSSTGKCDSNECCINYINIISDRSDLISLLLQVDNLYFSCYKMSF